MAISVLTPIWKPKKLSFKQLSFEPLQSQLAAFQKAAAKA